MSQNLRLGQYKSLNALAKVFELRDQNKYLFFLEKFKPFWLDKFYPKLEADFEKKELDAKTLFWLTSELKEKAGSAAVKNIISQCDKMSAKAKDENLEAFWALFPDLKQYVAEFLDDYYKIFPHLKPADFKEQNVVSTNI